MPGGNGREADGAAALFSNPKIPTVLQFLLQLLRRAGEYSGGCCGLSLLALVNWSWIEEGKEAHATAAAI